MNNNYLSKYIDNRYEFDKAIDNIHDAMMNGYEDEDTYEIAGNILNEIYEAIKYGNSSILPCKDDIDEFAKLIKKNCKTYPEINKHIHTMKIRYNRLCKNK